MTIGEQQLDELLRNMQPVLLPDVFVYVTVARRSSEWQAVESAEVAVIMQFEEQEGTTLVMTQTDASSLKLPFVYPCRIITLNIHSALEAVGFLARITTHLAAHGLSVNPVSAYYHDHLLVPEDRANEAVDLLAELQTA